MTVTYSGSTLAESSANDGTITQKLTLTLTNDTFTGADNAVLAGAAVTNVPGGLTAVVTRTSATTAELSLTGSATTHANADDINNLTVTLGNTAFTSANAAAITGAIKSNIVVDFGDPRTITYSGNTFNERPVVGSDGNDGSIPTTLTLTLANDTFTGADNAVVAGVTVTNLPSGLTAVMTRTSATTAELSLTGFAWSHDDFNDVAHLTVTFGNGAFTSGVAVGIVGRVNSDLIIDFFD